MHQHTQISEGLRKGDKGVLEEIYGTCFDRIKFWVLQNKGDQQSAEDLFQDALTIIYKKLQDPAFRIEHQFFTYLFSICRNLWLKRLRDDRVLGKSEPLEWEFLEERDLPGTDTIDLREQIFRRKFAQLGKTCQQILRLALEGKTPQEIATEMQLKSERHATNRKSYCKQQLAEMVQSDPMYKELQS